MNIFIKLNLISILLICFIGVKGQTGFRPGYVITSGNDTLHGLIDYRGEKGNAQKCVFKASETAAVKEYKPFDIRGYRFKDSKYYVSKTVLIDGVKTNLFLEFLVHGTADLYSFTDENNSYFFIQRPDRKIVELAVRKVFTKNDKTLYLRERNEYIDTLKYVLSDSPRFFPMIEKTALDASSLMTLIKRYNNFVSSEGSVFYEKQPSDAKLTIAPFVSMNSSSLKFDHSPLYGAVDFEKTYSPSIGVQLNVALPKSTRTLSFQASAEVGKSEFYGTGIHPLNSSLFEEVYPQIIYLKGKLGLKYTYPTGKFRPTLMIGGNIIDLLKKDGRRVEDFTNNSTIFINEINENIMARTLYGYDVELGIDCHISSSFFPFISIGYTGSTGNNMGNEARLYTDPSKPLTTILKTFNINAGLYF